MKHKMNQVTPKAGTLKQTSWKTIQNVSTKLIASVLMLAVIALTPVSLVAGMKNGDSCCATAKADFPKGIYLTLPSSEMVKRADSEMNRNLYRSLRESKVSRFAKLFAVADAEINGVFKTETTISRIAVENADEIAQAYFAAENIVPTVALSADNDLNDQFALENSITSTWDPASGDEQINTAFSAENISVPGSESMSMADQQIHQQMMNEISANFPVNSAR